MTKKIKVKFLIAVLIISLSFTVNNCSGKKGNKDDEKKSSMKNILITGYYSEGRNLWMPCYWLNGNKIDLPRISDNKGYAFSSFIKNGNIYTAGSTQDTVVNA